MGYGILVSSVPKESNAIFSVRDPSEVQNPSQDLYIRFFGLGSSQISFESWLELTDLNVSKYHGGSC